MYPKFELARYVRNWILRRLPHGHIFLHSCNVRFQCRDDAKWAYTMLYEEKAVVTVVFPPEPSEAVLFHEIGHAWACWNFLEDGAVIAEQWRHEAVAEYVAGCYKAGHDVDEDIARTILLGSKRTFGQTGSPAG